MKEFKGISLFFAICVTALLSMTVGLLIGMKLSIQGPGREKKEAQDLSKIEKKLSEEQEKQEFSSFLDVSSNAEELRQDTEFLIRQADLRTGEIVEVKEELPQKYVGMNLSSFLAATQQYNQAPPLAEREKGFSGMEVIKFSRDLLIVQKNYLRALPDEGFYLALMDRFVVVFREDKSTIYMNTDISLQMLPQDLQEALADMIYVENEAALFDFLEAYSS